MTLAKILDEIERHARTYDEERLVKALRYCKNNIIERKKKIETRNRIMTPEQASDIIRLLNRLDIGQNFEITFLFVILVMIVVYPIHWKK